MNKGIGEALMLASLKTPKFPRNGLAISETSVSVARTEGARGAILVSQHAAVSFSKGLVYSDFASGGFDAPRLESAILECAEKAGLADKRNWNLALPNGCGKIAAFSLDSEPKSSRELEEILEWKASSAFSLEPEFLRLASERISNDVDGKPRYLISAVSKEVLRLFEDVVARLGWNLGLVLPRPLAESAVLNDGSQADSLLLGFSEDGFSGMVLSGPDPLMVRNVSCTEEELSDELYRLALFYSDRFGSEGRELSRILATGIRFDLESLAEVCSEALGYPIAILNGDLVGLNGDAVTSESDVAAVGVSSVSA